MEGRVGRGGRSVGDSLDWRAELTVDLCRRSYWVKEGMSTLSARKFVQRKGISGIGSSGAAERRSSEQFQLSINWKEDFYGLEPSAGAHFVRR
jgi:hypothetical protein